MRLIPRLLGALGKKARRTSSKHPAQVPRGSTIPPRESFEHMLKVLELALWRMQAAGCPVFFVEGFSRKSGWPFAARAQARIDGKLKFHTLIKEPERYEADLRDIFLEKYSPQYLARMGNPSRIVLIDGRYCILNSDDEFYTVRDGRRLTLGQPDVPYTTVHIYGACTIAGAPWIENADTIPSQLQAKLVADGHQHICVQNEGIRGFGESIGDTFAGIIHNLALDSLSFGSNDCVVLYDMYQRMLPAAQALGLDVFDVASELPVNEVTTSNLVETPAHIGYAFNTQIAGLLASYLEECDFKQPLAMRKPGYDDAILFDHLRTGVQGDFDAKAAAYTAAILKEFGEPAPGACVGAIVMNANPFTLGHRYLVERALAQVDRLYVFVVQEDRSAFSFDDRLAMVRAGTAGLKGVAVVPSGRFAISSETLPEYFVKENDPDLVIDASKDVRVFATLIAPALHISKRFFGEERNDPVTAQYNEEMARLLPTYGIEFVEFARLEREGGEAISAGTARRLVEERRWGELKSYLPSSTLAYLMERDLGA